MGVQLRHGFVTTMWIYIANTKSCVVEVDKSWNLYERCEVGNHIRIHTWMMEIFACVKDAVWLVEG